MIVYAYWQGGEIERAQRVLAGAQTEKLHPYDQASILREQGLLDLHEGRLKPAIRSLEQAFEIALTDPITACFRGNIAASTADVLSRLGRDARVLSVVAHALPTSSAPQCARLLFMRAFSHRNTGQLREAERDLEDARTSDASAVLPPMERYSHGVLRHGFLVKRLRLARATEKSRFCGSSLLLVQGLSGRFNSSAFRTSSLGHKEVYQSSEQS